MALRGWTGWSRGGQYNAGRVLNGGTAMRTNGAAVGRFKVELELANNDDMAAVRRGDLEPDKVRRVKILGVVDSGAARLVLPQDAVKKLGLVSTAKVKVRYANNSVAKRPLWKESIWSCRAATAFSTPSWNPNATPP